MTKQTTYLCLWKNKMMVKPKTFIRTGITLSFLAIFFIALGSHLLHPFFHNHKPAHSHSADHSDHYIHLTSIKAAENCPICLLFSSAKLFDKASATAKTPLLLPAKNASQYKFPSAQKSYYKLFFSRAPPFSTFS